MSQPPRKVIHLPKVRMLRPNAGRAASGIKITHVTSIKPPDPNAVKKLEEEKLRAQLQKEIVSRSRLCANKSYECLLPVLSGREYCYTHILKDPTAPYKQCAHVYVNGDRCAEPAPIEQKDHRDLGLCFEHARSALVSRQRAAAPAPPPATAEALLLQLQHYVRPERPRTTSCASTVSVVSDQNDLDVGVPNAVDPFKQIDATAVNNQYSSSIMECASASDSDSDGVVIGGDMDVRAREEMLATNEEAPCETEPLWRAGVYTAEEAVGEARRLVRGLRAAYRRQMARLAHLLRAARHHYLHALKQEKDTYCNINTQARNGSLTVRERRQLRKLKAYASYHTKHGVDAVLARKLHRKRAKQGSGLNSKVVPIQGRCLFLEGGVRCESRALPAAKHCPKHILHDRHQVLFVACGDERGCGGCGEAAPRTPLPAACVYHRRPPRPAGFRPQKDDTDSDSDSHSSSDESQTEDFTGHSTDDHHEAEQAPMPYE